MINSWDLKEALVYDQSTVPPGLKTVPLMVSSLSQEIQVQTVHCVLCIQTEEAVC